jgi:hypothetical protein
MTELLTVKKVDSDILSLLYHGLNKDDNDKDYKPDKKYFTLSKPIIDTDINSVVISKIKELVEYIEPSYTIDIRETNQKNFIQISKASNKIAIEGRIGPGQKILISENNFNKYFPTTKSYFNDFLKVIFVENLDYLIVYRNNYDDQPGLILIENGINFDVIGIGFYPEKQFCKIELI